MESVMTVEEIKKNVKALKKRGLKSKVLKLAGITRQAYKYVEETGSIRLDNALKITKAINTFK